jgi:hypothetical protein
VPTLDDNASAAVGPTSGSIAATVTPRTGDILVVKAVTEEAGSVPLNTPTDTAGNTWTLRTSSTVGSTTAGYIWTAVSVGSAAMTVTVVKTFGAGVSSAPGAASITAEVWGNADLPASPVTASAQSSGSPSAVLTTSQDNSVITWLNGDWSANSPGSRTYNTTSGTPVEEFIDDSPGRYVAYYAYQGAASAGSKTFGVSTAAGQVYTLLGLEVLDVPAGPSGIDPDQYDRQPWH